MHLWIYSIEIENERERERERERQRVRVCVLEGEREREIVCVFSKVIQRLVQNFYRVVSSKFVCYCLRKKDYFCSF